MKPLRTLVVDDANGSGTLDALRLDRGIDVVASLGFEGLVDEVRAKQPAVLVLIPRSQSQALSVIEQVMAKHPVPILVLGDDSLSRERVLGAGALTLALLDNALRRATRAALGSYACFLLAGVLVTQTRSALTGIALAGVLVIALVWLRYPIGRARAMTLGGGIVSVGVLALVLFFTPLGISD